MKIIEQERADPKFRKKAEQNEKKVVYYERLYKQTEKAKKYGIIDMFNKESLNKNANFKKFFWKSREHHEREKRNASERGQPEPRIAEFEEKTPSFGDPNLVFY